MTAVSFNLSGISVFLAMPINRDLPWQTCRSLVETQSLMQAKGVPFNIQFQVGCSIVHMARNHALHEFLKTESTRLFWVDSDISWKADDFYRLVVLSSEMDVVCGMYPRKKEPIKFMFGKDFCAETVSNEFGCFPMSGTGIGFTIINRGIIEHLAAAAPKVMYDTYADPIAYVFRCDIHDGEARGEDMAFFADVKDAGYKAWMDPTVILSHIGQKAYSGNVMDCAVRHD